MAALARKQRELRERESLLLDAARRILVEGGYHGLTMARVAEALEYSKGTIYSHSSCKSDVGALVLPVSRFCTKSAVAQRVEAAQESEYRKGGGSLPNRVDG